jgi:transposase
MGINLASQHRHAVRSWIFIVLTYQLTARVYNLKPQRVRVVSTTASGYCMVTPDGLFQYRRSKDYRPDLPQ